jgi:stress response protein YsnF
MTQTVIGLFDDASEARRAVERLTQQGVSRQSIDIRENETGGTDTVSRDRDDNENGITRFFKSLFGDNDDADRYSKAGNNSRCIVTVHANSRDEAERAADILDDCGAIDVNERAGGYGQASQSRQGVENRRETTIPRVEENLEVGKRTEERSGVRVRSRIVERPVEEHVRLREELVHVERQPANRPVSSEDANQMQDRDIELTERSEVPVVNKEARVVEEVKVSKDVTERDETIRDTVRKTEIDVDKTDGRNKGGRSRDDRSDQQRR